MKYLLLFLFISCNSNELENRVKFLERKVRKLEYLEKAEKLEKKRIEMNNEKGET